MKLFYVITGVFLLNMFIVACGQSPVEKKEARHFDMKDFTTTQLPESLREISGIALYPLEVPSLLAVEDETGTIYTIQETGEILKQTAFAEKGDYEGIATSAQFAYILRSDGAIYALPLEGIKEPSVTAIKMYNILPKGEYESIAYDADAKGLVVLPKEKKSDDKADVTSVFFITIAADGLQLGKTKEIKADQISNFIRLKGALRPSAVAKDPVTKEWYVLASMNKALLVFDAEWNVVEAMKLDKKVFPQPEGMVFDHNGDLLISNEGGKVGEGTLIKLKRR